MSSGVIGRRVIPKGLSLPSKTLKRQLVQSSSSQWRSTAYASIKQQPQRKQNLLQASFFNPTDDNAPYYMSTTKRSKTTSSLDLTSLLDQVANGTLSTKNAKHQLRQFEQLEQKTIKSSEPNEVLESFANLDHSRAERTSFPEAVFAAGKTPEQIVTILEDMADNVNRLVQKELEEGTFMSSVGSSSSKAILATRVDKDLYSQIVALPPLENGTITYNEMANIITMKASSLEGLTETPTTTTTTNGNIIVACAGTTDLPVAEEAAITLQAANVNVTRLYDVGVAGLHRILNALPKLQDPDVDCIIVCAGMDGALPSVVAGLVSCPVVAVPTSVGYGASFGGVSAMLTMLNSCAPGVGVVNIDNGFGGAALAFKCMGRK